MTSVNDETVLGTVVICAALDVEYLAVREHLHGPFSEREERGALYEIGAFRANRGRWTVALAQTGAGTAQAGIEMERAISVFHPQMVLFVGVAGGRKDVALGDVVIADHIYDYESGKDTATDYLPRIKTTAPSMRLLRRAQQLARDAGWQHRILPAAPPTQPKALIKPVATGSKVIADANSVTAHFLQRYCGDAAAVEMEGSGFLHGAYVNDAAQALVVRGISDLLSGKTETADEQWQRTASRHAAAFAFELLARYTPTPTPTPNPVLDSAQAHTAYTTALRLEGSRDKTAKDLVEIERLYREAAAAGYADAMARLGLIVEGHLRATLLGQKPGEPSAADVETAMHWYTKSAELGSGFGALYLGRLYEERLGKPAEALEWYEKAAADGHGDARSRLDGLHRRLSFGLGALAGHTPFDQTPSDRGPSRRKPMPTSTDYERWIKEEWRGSEPWALAVCLDRLAEACGGHYGEWGTLPTNEVAAVLGHFRALMPTLIHAPAVAFEYYDHIGEGNLRVFAAEVLANPRSATRAKELAPVWWRQRGENRVSTQEYDYRFELTMRDYDTLASMLGDPTMNSLVDKRATSAKHDETVLSLRMISREMAKRRNQSRSLGSGDEEGDKRVFSLLLTPEYMAILVHVAAAQTRDRQIPPGSRELWQHVHTALKTSNATPFT